MLDALRGLGRPRATVSVVLGDDRLVRGLNRDYRDLDETTDVLSFAMADPEALRNTEAAVFLGEIYVSVETARRQARGHRRPFPRELAHLVIHGLLHLVGHDHRTRGQARLMQREERRLMRALAGRIAALQVL